MTATTGGAALGDVVGAAERLVTAQERGVPCAPVRDLVPTTVEAGYAVQQLLTEASLARGRRVVGRKVGLTNPVVQTQLGVDQPDSGVLFDDMAVADGEVVDTGRLLQPRIEAEVAVVLGADLHGDEDDDALRAAVAQVVAALEVVDSRIAGWDLTIVDTVADNGSSALFVLGRDAVPLGDLDLRDVVMTLGRDGERVSSGRGVDCLGDPLAALGWLARTASGQGAPLRAGDVVLTGALGPMVPVVPGSTYSAEVSGLGGVSVTFSDRHSSDQTEEAR